MVGIWVLIPRPWQKKYSQYDDKLYDKLKMKFIIEKKHLINLKRLFLNKFLIKIFKDLVHYLVNNVL